MIWAIGQNQSPFIDLFFYELFCLFQGASSQSEVIEALHKTPIKLRWIPSRNFPGENLPKAFHALRALTLDG